MAKTRVHELAKTLGINSKKLIERLKELGVEVKTHMSAIDDEIVNTVLELYTSEESTSSEPDKVKAESDKSPKKDEKQNVSENKTKKDNNKLDDKGASSEIGEEKPGIDRG